MLKALKGDAFAAAEPLSGVCTWQQLLEILRGKFTTVHSLDVLMGQFYQITQGPDTVAQFCYQAGKPFRVHQKQSSWCNQ